MPRDANQLAKMVVDMTLGEEESEADEARELLAALVKAGEVVPPRGSPGWKPSDVRVRAWEDAQKQAHAFLDRTQERVKDPASVELGRLGGLIGGKRRAEKLSSERRSEIARKAAAARWGKEI